MFDINYTVIFQKQNLLTSLQFISSFTVSRNDVKYLEIMFVKACP